MVAGTWRRRDTLSTALARSSLSPTTTAACCTWRRSATARTRLCPCTTSCVPRHGAGRSTGALIEVVAETDRKHQTSVQRVLQRRCEQRPRLLVAPRKQQPADEREGHRNRIAKDNVRKRKPPALARIIPSAPGNKL